MSVFVLQDERDSDGQIVNRSLLDGSAEEFDKLAAKPGVLKCSGFIDLYARLCEPGFTRKGSIASETKAAVANGILNLVCSPDTDPVIDNTATVELVCHRAQASGYSQVLPMGALTKQLEGTQLSEMATLSDSGCVAFGQADQPLDNTRVLISAMEYAATFDYPIVLTPRDAFVLSDGCAHDGATATRLGLPGIPVVTETAALAKLIELARSTGCRLHVSRLSSARAATLVADAKASGLAITADVGIHHLYFTDEQLEGFDTNFHSVVPFRSTTDRAALREALVDGTIDAICSDHSPQDLDAKLAPFPSSEPGLNGLDFFLPLLFGLTQVLDLSSEQLLKRVTENPANILGLADDSIGNVLIDPGSGVNLAETALLSGGANSPLVGKPSLKDVTGENIPLLGVLLAAKTR